MYLITNDDPENDENEINQIEIEKYYGSYKVKRKGRTFSIYKEGYLESWDLEPYEVVNYLYSNGIRF